MEMKTVHREIKDLDIAEIIASVIELLQLEIKKKNLNVKWEQSGNISHIKADSDEITRLFTNLLSNAVKYNKNNGNIEIKMKMTGNYILTSINDTGIGMKPEEKKKLFHEFFRAKNELTKDISGTGLGLSIMKRIVDSYAGKIEVESEFGKGTSFNVYLPV
jgi:signal transduction histidine kinase